MAPIPCSVSQRFLAFLFVLPVLAAMTGCGVDTVNTTTSGTLALHGIVHGGQQPVTSSQIRLYAAGKTGNGSAPRDMLSVTPAGGGAAVDYVTTDSSGNFTITTDYSCTSSSDQVYIVATGGYPGPSPNPALTMVAALGSCVNVPSISNIFIDEVTTAAAAWALAPFTSATGQIGASATNTTGIANAFLDTQLLANSTNGLPAALLSTQSIQTAKLYALANILAGCVNSDGTAACGPLFSAATTPSGSMPTNTWLAALNIVKNPGYHVGPVFMALPAQPPYPSQLTQAPNDWTMTMTVSGGGIFSPTAMGVDPSGQVWVADYYGGVTGYSPQGVPLAGTPYGVGTPQAGDTAPDGEGHGALYEVYGLAVDTSGNVWATVEEKPYHGGTFGSVVTFAGSSSGSALGTELGQFYDTSIDYPESMAPDRLGNVDIGNYASGSVTIYTNAASGTKVQGGVGDYTNSSGGTSSDAAFPVSIAPDGLGGTWIGNNDYTITHVDAYGNLYRPNCCDDVDGITADAQGNGWAANYYGSSISKVSPGSVTNGVYTPGTVLLNQVTGGGITYPAGVALDNGQNVWIANYRGQSISEVSSTGTPVSPSTGYGLDTAMSLPFGISPDASGNLWVTNFGNNTVTMFFGLAAPTSTPVTAPQTAP
jgi:hypothetical protein